MTSTSKMVLFFVAATVFNIPMSILVIVFWVVAAIVPAPNIRLIILFVGFIASIVLTFLAYGRLMKWVTVRFELEKHIPQLFKGRKRQPAGRLHGLHTGHQRSRSIRSYDPTKPVDKAVLEKILEAGRIAPSAANRQPGGFLLVSSREMLNQVRRCYQKPWFQDAPHVLIVAGGTGDPGRVRTLELDRDRPRDRPGPHGAGGGERGCRTCWIAAYEPRSFLRTALNLTSEDRSTRSRPWDTRGRASARRDSGSGKRFRRW